VVTSNPDLNLTYVSILELQDISHMDLRATLDRRLRHEIREELHNEYETSQEQLDALIAKLEMPELTTLMDRQCEPADIQEHRCCARVWDNKRGTRCSLPRSKSLKDSEYCKKHQEQVMGGKLRLGRFDEPRPTLNEKGERFDWDEGFAHLDTVFQYQQVLLHRLIVSNH
jgi:hypothetical protein